jgi:hypothetical protein
MVSLEVRFFPSASIFSEAPDVNWFSQILTGLPPFHYFSNVSFVIVTVAGGGRPDPHQYELSPLLDEFWPLLEACWDASPQERPTIDQLVHEIQAARAQHA